MMNEVTLVGRIGQHEELRAAGASYVLKSSLATWESYKDQAGEWQQYTEWHNLELWGNMAERYSKIGKGQVVIVKGKIKTDTWEKDGKKMKSTKIKVTTFRHIKPKTDPNTLTPEVESTGSIADMANEALKTSGYEEGTPF